MYVAVTLVGVLIWVFVAVARLALARADVPISELFHRFRPRLPLLVLPGLITPLFLAGYTIAKTSVARLVPARWDAEWAALDRWIFGEDPWRISHAWLGHAATAAMEDFYTMIWGGALVVSAVAVTLIAGRRLIGRFFLAMSLAWMTGGILLASLMWAAGPVFAPHFDPALADRFTPLQQALAALLDPNSPILLTQKYLLRELGLQSVAKGGGISAMPSMHIAAATIYVLASWRTWWLVPSLLFLALTFLGSVHFGYHYAVDAPVAALVAILCWKLAGWWFRSADAQLRRAERPAGQP
jgi:hypothetical protein